MRTLASADLRLQVGGVMVKEVSEVGGGKVVEGLVGDEEDFKLDSLLDGEPVEVLEDWGEVKLHSARLRSFKSIQMLVTQAHLNP